MRVIAGELKGRRLKTVPHKGTRETSDKVKEAFFHKIGPFFSGGICLDLFAGSGSLGIEALSRGFDRAIFVDKSPAAVRTIVENINALQLVERCEVYRNDAMRALDKLKERNVKFSLIFIDPPYNSTLYESIVEKIIEKNILAINGYIYLEHQANMAPLSLLPELHIIDQKTYSSTTAITILQRLDDGNDEEVTK